jgi:hypothetical protein
MQASVHTTIDKSAALKDCEAVLYPDKILDKQGNRIYIGRCYIGQRTYRKKIDLNNAPDTLIGFPTVWICGGLAEQQEISR